MKQHRTLSMALAALACMALLVPLAGGRQDRQQEILLQKAIQKETVDGELKTAITMYRQILANPGENRTVAAKALLQIGKCYEKLGSAEAPKAYEQLLSEYPDQREITTEARTRLAALAKSEDDSGITMRQVWAGPSADYYAAPTPDGRHLIYVDWETGDLAIRELADGKSRRLTDGAGNGDCALESRVSPDGKLIAYSWRKGPYPGYTGVDLRLIGIDGKGSRILRSEKGYDYEPLAWSSDSRLVAVRRYGSGKGTEIALVDINDGSLRILKTVPSSRPFMSFSPDNQYLAFDFPVAEDGGKYDISLLALDGSGEIPLVRHPADDRLSGWIPGSQQILFGSDRSGTIDLWVTRFEDGKSQLISEPIKRAFGGVERRVGFTSDGSYFFTIYSRHFALQVVPVDPETGNFTVGAGKAILGSNSRPEWSPDGKQLAYIAEFDLGNRRRLHVRNVGIGEERELVPDFQAACPRWSPDGESILIWGRGRDEGQKEGEFRGGIYRINTAGGEVAPVVLWMQPERPTDALFWGRAGRSIIYDHGGCLRTRELKSGEERELYCNPTFARGAALSPDGKTLAFATIDTPRNIVRLLLMSIDGGKPRLLLEVPGKRIENLAWTPDGTHLLFTDLENNFEVLHRISREGGDPEVLWRSKRPSPCGLAGLSFHPDGKRIAVSTYVQESELWVMENLRQLVK